MKPLRTWSRSRRACAVALLVVLAAAIWYAADEWLFPPHRLDPAIPWHIEIGQGSGMEGLNTTKVSSGGAVVLHRLNYTGDPPRYPVWETAALTLPPDAVAAVLSSVEKNRLLGLSKSYHPWPRINDGTQWVFRAQQGGYERAVYFDNEFPRAIRRFAADLRRVLNANGLGAAVWSRVPDTEAREHERGLWDSIK